MRLELRTHPWRKTSPFFLRWWKKQTFGENEGLIFLGVLWKNGYQISPVAQVTGIWSDRKWTKFETGSQKYIFGKLEKTDWRVVFSFSDNVSLDGGKKPLKPYQWRWRHHRKWCGAKSPHPWSSHNFWPQQMDGKPLFLLWIFYKYRFSIRSRSKKNWTF